MTLTRRTTLPEKLPHDNGDTLRVPFYKQEPVSRRHPLVTSWDSSVGIATRLRSGRPRSGEGVRLLVGTRDFSFLPPSLLYRRLTFCDCTDFLPRLRIPFLFNFAGLRGVKLSPFRSSATSCALVPAPNGG